MKLLVFGILILCFGTILFCLLLKRKGKNAAGTAVVTSEEPSVVEQPADEKPMVQPNELPSEPSPEPEESEPTVTHNRQLVANLHKVLEEDKVFLRPDIRIDDVAKMLLTNRTYVTRLMRQEYGLSFIEYVNVARIQYSQSLLYKSDMSLDEIAEKSGFQSTSNYCRAFKRYIGQSPMVWLQSVK